MNQLSATEAAVQPVPLTRSLDDTISWLKRSAPFQPCKDASGERCPQLEAPGNPLPSELLRETVRQARRKEEEFGKRLPGLAMAEQWHAFNRQHEQQDADAGMVYVFGQGFRINPRSREWALHQVGDALFRRFLRDTEQEHVTVSQYRAKQGWAKGKSQGRGKAGKAAPVHQGNPPLLQANISPFMLDESEARALEQSEEGSQERLELEGRLKARHLHFVQEHIDCWEAFAYICTGRRAREPTMLELMQHRPARIPVCRGLDKRPIPPEDPRGIQGSGVWCQALGPFEPVGPFQGLSVFKSTYKAKESDPGPEYALQLPDAEQELAQYMDDGDALQKVLKQQHAYDVSRYSLDLTFDAARAYRSVPEEHMQGFRFIGGGDLHQLLVYLGPCNTEGNLLGFLNDAVEAPMDAANERAAPSYDAEARRRNNCCFIELLYGQVPQQYVDVSSRKDFCRNLKSGVLKWDAAGDHVAGPGWAAGWATAVVCSTKSINEEELGLTYQGDYWTYIAQTEPFLKDNRDIYVATLRERARAAAAAKEAQAALERQVQLLVEERLDALDAQARLNILQEDFNKLQHDLKRGVIRPQAAPEPSAHSCVGSNHNSVAAKARQQRVLLPSSSTVTPQMRSGSDFEPDIISDVDSTMQRRQRRRLQEGLEREEGRSHDAAEGPCRTLAVGVC